MYESAFIFLFRALGTLLNFIEGYYFMKCIGCCLAGRGGRLAFPAGLAGYSLVSCIVIFPNDLVNISLAAVLFAVLNFLIYHGEWSVKLALIVILLPVSSALNFLVFDITGKLYFQYFTAEDKLANAFFSNLSALLPTVFFAFFYHFFHEALEKMQHTFTGRTWLLISIICTASFAGVFSCLYLSADYCKSYTVWPCMLACIVTNTGSLHLASCLADGIYADLERQNLRLQHNYYEELEKNQNQIRKLRHDMNSHLAVVGQLLQKGDTEKAKAYFSEISSFMQDSSRKFCQNSVVNAVLNARCSRMQEAGIDSFFHISIDGMMLLDDVSLCTIFANTLDNAIEACLKIDSAQERRIQLKCRYTENGYFSFELINSKNNPITERNGQIISDKEDRKLHGIGLSSVRGIVDRYKGTLDLSYDECSFKVIILIG